MSTRYAAPQQGYDWLDPDPAGGLPARRFAAPAQGVDDLDAAWNSRASNRAPAGPGNPMYDYLAGTRLDMPSDAEVVAFVQEADKPTTLEEARLAIDAGSLPMPPWATDKPTLYVAADGSEHTTEYAANMTSAAHTGVCWTCGEPGHLNCGRDAVPVVAPAAPVAATGATLEVMRFEPVRFAAPVIVDRDGAVVPPKLAAKRDQMMTAVREYSALDPRSQQKRIGPSEIGDPCDARILRKLYDFPAVAQPDPWASFVGTAVHAKLAEVFAAVNEAARRERYLIERRVWPTQLISGSTDLAELVEVSTDVPGSRVVDIYDHKILGTDGFRQAKTDKADPRSKYGTQLDIYALGWRRAGYTVRTVNLALWPRSGFLDGLLVIERPPDFGSAELAIERLTYLRDVGDRVDAAEADEPWVDGRVDTSPGKGCGFCPYYSPTLPMGRLSCDRGRDFMAGAKRGTGTRGVTP